MPAISSANLPRPTPRPPRFSTISPGSSPSPPAGTPHPPTKSSPSPAEPPVCSQTSPSSSTPSLRPSPTPRIFPPPSKPHPAHWPWPVQMPRSPRKSVLIWNVTAIPAPSGNNIDASCFFLRSYGPHPCDRHHSNPKSPATMSAALAPSTHPIHFSHSPLSPSR